MSKEIEKLLRVIILQNQVLIMTRHNASIGMGNDEDIKTNKDMIEEMQIVVDKVLDENP